MYFPYIWSIFAYSFCTCLMSHRQMTWDCIEAGGSQSAPAFGDGENLGQVFIPGFGEEFSKSLLGSPPAKEAMLGEAKIISLVCVPLTWSGCLFQNFAGEFQCFTFVLRGHSVPHYRYLRVACRRGFHDRFVRCHQTKSKPLRKPWHKNTFTSECQELTDHQAQVNCLSLDIPKTTKSPRRRVVSAAFAWLRRDVQIQRGLGALHFCAPAAVSQDQPLGDPAVNDFGDMQ